MNTRRTFWGLYTLALFALLACLCARFAQAAGRPGPPQAYYVDSILGDDNNAGTLAAPWRTDAKVNRTTFWPGDNILFKRGGIYGAAQNDTCLVVSSSGVADSAIVYGAYGVGAMPVQTGGMPLKGWMKTYDVTTDSTNQRPFRSGIAYGPDTLTVDGRTGMNFDGVDDYIDLGADPIGTGDFTWFGWVQVPALRPAKHGMLFSNAKSNSTKGIQVYHSSTSGGIVIVTGGIYALTSANALTPNAYHFITVAMHDSTVQVTVDKVNVTSDSTSGTRKVGDTNLLLGNSQALDRPFLGQLSGVGLLQYDITPYGQAAIDSLYAGTLANITHPQANKLLGYWPLTSGFASSTTPLWATYRGTAADSAYAAWEGPTLLTRVHKRSDVTTGKWFQGLNGITATGNTNDYLYLAADADTSGVESSNVKAITATGKQNITIREIEATRGVGTPGSGMTATIHINGSYITIERCKVYDTARGSDILVYGGNNNYCVVRGCLLGDTSKTLTQNVSLYMTGTGNKAYNNTLLSQSNAIQTGGGLDLRNNLAVAQRWLRLDAGAYTGNNNLFYDIDGRMIGYLGQSGTSVYSMAAWGDSTGQDLDIITEDPKFRDAANGDYRLRAGSPAIDAGEIIPGLSYLGTAPDIGAYEYAAESAYVRRYLFKAGYKPPLFGDNRKPQIWSNQ